MTTFLDNNIRTFEILLSWRFPRLGGMEGASFSNSTPLRRRPPHNQVFFADSTGEAPDQHMSDVPPGDMW